MRTFSICPRDWSNELSIANAITVIREKFPLAVIDKEQGRDKAAQILDRLRSLNAPDEVQQIYVKCGNDAVLIRLDEQSTKPFLLMPKEGILLSCDDEAWADKLAAALGYECLETG
jgi:hypothetical protein